MALEQAAPAPTQRRKRRKMPWSFLIAGVAVTGAILYLVIANTSAAAEYYMTVGELRHCTTCTRQAVRVAGIVAPGSVVRGAGGQVIHFTITDSGQSLPVVYSGIVPDIFRPGIQVVVEGQLTTGGVFSARNLLAKCPSKFQAATPNAGK
ncbi:MAG: cytochrome c maturation protein CcmE [Ktedonobacterales bacterium]|nr:cytochrome c maturation protein CcmE [Ktedonobacterales bacterium]